MEFPGLCPALAIPLHPIPLGKSSTRPAVCRCQVLKSPILGGGLGRGSGLQPFPSSLHDLGKSPPLAPCMLCEGRHHATLLTPFYDSAWHTAMDLVKYITQNLLLPGLPDSNKRPPSYNHSGQKPWWHLLAPHIQSIRWSAQPPKEILLSSSTAPTAFVKATNLIQKCAALVRNVYI